MYELSSTGRENISKILGKDYASIKIARHTLYRIEVWNCQEKSRQKTPKI